MKNRNTYMMFGFVLLLSLALIAVVQSGPTLAAGPVAAPVSHKGDSPARTRIPCTPTPQAVPRGQSDSEECDEDGTPSVTTTGTVQASGTANVTGTAQATVSRTVQPITTAQTTGTTAAPSATSCVFTFSDVQQGNVFYDDIYFLACRTIVNGFGDGTFRPNANTSRAQFTKITVLAFNLPTFTPPSPTFSDVPTSNFFYTFVESAVHAGAIQGYPNGTFHPDDNVSRAQLAVIIQRVRNYTPFTPATPTFSDLRPANFGYAAVETLYRYGIVTGQPCSTGLCFFPDNPVRRGELSRIVRRAMQTQGTPAATTTSVAATSTVRPSTTVPATSTRVPATTTSVPPATSTPGVVVVTMGRNFFAPPNLTVARGTTVRWNNTDGTHTVTSQGGGPLNSGTMSQGQSYQFTFTTAGTYNYICDFHEQMVGTITVQ